MIVRLEGCLVQGAKQGAPGRWVTLSSMGMKSWLSQGSSVSRGTLPPRKQALMMLVCKSCQIPSVVRLNFLFVYLSVCLFVSWLFCFLLLVIRCSCLANVVFFYNIIGRRLQTIFSLFDVLTQKESHNLHCP